MAFGNSVLFKREGKRRRQDDVVLESYQFDGVLVVGENVPVKACHLEAVCSAQLADAHQLLPSNQNIPNRTSLSSGELRVSPPSPDVGEASICRSPAVSRNSATRDLASSDKLEINLTVAKSLDLISSEDIDQQLLNPPSAISNSSLLSLAGINAVSGNLALPARTVERLQDAADGSGSFAACMMHGLQTNGVVVPSSSDLALHFVDQSSCPSMGKLKRNLEVIRKQLNASRACDIEDYSISLAELVVLLYYWVDEGVFGSFALASCHMQQLPDWQLGPDATLLDCPLPSLVQIAGLGEDWFGNLAWLVSWWRCAFSWSRYGNVSIGQTGSFSHKIMFSCFHAWFAGMGPFARMGLWQLTHLLVYTVVGVLVCPVGMPDLANSDDFALIGISVPSLSRSRLGHLDSRWLSDRYATLPQMPQWHVGPSVAFCRISFWPITPAHCQVGFFSDWIWTRLFCWLD
ncbi:hypothetical protein Nepgr_006581 [Nepenthes gracilis]|uniref:Uncharacterized protein n=1 Tax=Nepenthes gracilis TaxID=150966 RepID=A0AAD3XHR0_NEPGR|nr:hypothetical protein Nepgr_006581 [Nepenthes gracilis]